jgi:alpha 1,3-glucosidase
MPPLCTLGKHQSRWNYVDVEDSLNVNKGFDRNDIPYDVLWLDIDHTDGKKYFTWHPTHFADPDKLLDGLNASKRKLVTIVDPHIKRESGYGVFEKLKDMDFMTKTHSGSQYDGWCWPGTSYYPDFCNPAMRDQWAKFFHMDYYPHNRPDLYTWNDMNEPSVFNGPEVSMPRDNLHKCHTNGYGVEHREVHNVYGYYHHGATVQGQLERAPDVRPFVLTRSFFAGSHRHSAMWTGDNMARWDHLERSVPMLLTLGMCGMAFGGADVPGFFFDPEPELFRRWHQLGIWYPFYRGHAHLETKRREPWMLGDQITANVREQVTVRYQMMPTWYTIFAEWAMLGLPIMRPLWYHNLDDTKAFEYANTHFLVGDSILVRPIAQAGITRISTYLPANSAWYDFWNPKAKPEDGGNVVTQDAHFSHIPVFVKSGAILFKKMRRRRSTGAMVSDPYTIFVYGVSAKGHLYIDDGESHKFKSGSFIFEDFEFDGTSLRERPKTEPALSIGAAKGLSDWPKRQLRVERVVFVGLPKKATGAKLLHGVDAASPADMLQVTSEEAADGISWVTTVKKPTCLLGDKWSLELTF